MPENLRFAKLNESNYAEWSLYMRAILVKKGLWGVVDGAETRPTGSANSKTIRAYERRQSEAHAEIVLHLDPSQLPHAHNEDSRELWNELQRMHRAQGFATRMTLRRKFNTMTKRADQSMSSWIANVQQAAFRLKEVGYIATDEDKILVLTQGLPRSYDSFIISLDASIAAITNEDESKPEPAVSLEIVKARLINEEARQLAAKPIFPVRKNDKPDSEEAMSVEPKPRTPLSGITCFKCGKKGHYQLNCPEKALEDTAQVATEDSSDEDTAF
jgi:hypothetical protein